MAQLGRVGRVGGLTIELSDRSRRITVHVLIVVALGVTSWLFLALTAARHGYFDLRVYYGAINFWIHNDGQIYDYLLPRTEYGFTYPPFAAVLMSPMALVGWNGAIAISLSLSVASIFVVIYCFVDPVATRRGWPRWFTCVISLELTAVFEPVRETVNFGQVNLLLLVLVVMDLLILLQGRHRLAGIGVGLATAIKLTPGIFIIYLLVVRQWRAAGVAIATACGATWLAATIAPDASRVFWTDAVWNTDRVGSTAFVSNQSLNGIVSRLDPLAPSGSLCVALILVAFLVWARRARRAVTMCDGATAMALTGILGCLVSPITWIHHLVWVLPAVMLLLDSAMDANRPRWYRRCLFALMVFSYLVLSSRVVWLFEYHYHVVGSNLYALLLCLLLVVLPIRRLNTEEPVVAKSQHPVVDDVPDLVDLDRQVTAAFDAKDAGLPYEVADKPLAKVGNR